MSVSNEYDEVEGRREKRQCSSLNTASSSFSSSSVAEAEEMGDQLAKTAFLKTLGRHRYAIATTDTAFKHMLSLSMGSDSSIVISLINSFIPVFRGDPIVAVTEAPVAIPAL